MTKTNFQQVIDFNQGFGVKIYDKLQKDVLDDKKLVKYRLDLILEEVSELKEALDNRDMIEVIDALSDILYVTYGMGTAFGIDLDRSFDIVHRSNMSKLCSTEEEAKKTVEWYKQNEKRYDSPAYRQSDDLQHWVIYNESTGKILKNINYTPANFDTMLN